MAGIDVNCREETYDRTALHIAVSRDHLGCVQASVLHSHWSRNVEAWLSLVERFIVMLRQLSYAIKNQLGHPKPPIAPRWFFMA